MVYRRVPKPEIADKLTHLRNLHRAKRPATARDRLFQEKREIIVKNVLDNLYRTKEHPTLRTVLDLADVFSLTLDGAHRLFGYDLDSLRQLDLDLNGGRTHITEDHAFNQDRSIDLPLRLGGLSALTKSASLRKIVREVQEDLPIRVLEGDPWKMRGGYYVHVGTEDSLGSGLPPSSTALVEPISSDEEQKPNPRTIYLLQFGNGYRCSKCLVTKRKLFLLSDEGLPTGRREYVYPGSVRIVGRIRMFTLQLPLQKIPSPAMLPDSITSAPLVLPWEHTSRGSLFATKYKRFVRPRSQQADLDRVLRDVFETRLLERTARRYRRSSKAQPHIDTILQMVLSHATRYSDVLRFERAFSNDRKRYSLDALLRTSRLEDLESPERRASDPEPREVWSTLRQTFPDWPASLSMIFPRLHVLDENVVRLSRNASIRGLTPLIAEGSFMLLGQSPSDVQTLEQEQQQPSGWSRPLYGLQQGNEFHCGYLRLDEASISLTGDLRRGEPIVHLPMSDRHRLRRINGIAIPV